jgi:hypothetical protein
MLTGTTGRPFVAISSRTEHLIVAAGHNGITDMPKLEVSLM